MTEKVKPEVEDDDTPLEETEISFDDETDEEESEGIADPEEESTEDIETTEEVESEESEEETEESEASDDEEEAEGEPDTQLSDEEKQKQHNREMAERRIQEKKARDAEIKKQQDEYVAAAEDENTGAVRQLQVDAYNTKVSTNESKLKTDYARAMTDFPILADANPDIQAEVDQALDTFQGLHVTIDKWGNPAEVRGDLYQYLKAKSESIQRLTQIGAKKESNAKSKTKANTLTPPSRTPKEPKKDAMLDAFDEEAAK